MTRSTWDPIVVGVDASPAAGSAARFGWLLAESAGTTCQLVHATPDVWTPFTLMHGAEPAADLSRAVAEHARREVATVFQAYLAPPAIERLVVRAGRPATVLSRAVDEFGAGLVVLGGKHHSVLGRWLAGSTSLDLARISPVPVLVTVGTPGTVRRVLVALDATPAAAAAVEVAQRFARLFGAALKAVSVVEPLPLLAELPPAMAATEYHEAAEELVEAEVWPLLPAGSDRAILHGPVLSMLAGEAGAWRADLVVVGAHGKGWAERLLLGSVTERLLNHLPTSLVVVPVARLAGAEPAAVGRSWARRRINPAAARR